MASILDIIMRRVIGSVVGWGTRRGIDTIANRSKGTPTVAPSKTAKQRQRETAKRARQAARVTRVGRR